jgi:TatD DNase family protein
VAEDLEDSQINLQLAGSSGGDRPRLLPAAGLFPAGIDLERAGETASFIRTNHDRLQAIGEVGLDFWKDREEAQQEIQKEALRLFAALSVELDLPFNVHSRSAGRQTIQILLEAGARRVQMHAFDGKASSAMPGVEAGFLFSVPASVVRSRQKQKLVAALPLSCMMVETDSPVLGPDPEKRNEPANLPLAVRAVAEIKGVTVDEVRETATRNAAALYCVEGLYES